MPPTTEIYEAVGLPIPVKGIYQGCSAAEQPKGTYVDGLNLRSLSSGDRTRIGKRDGYSKVFSTQGGTSAARRINALGGFANTPQEGIGTDSAPAPQTLTPSGGASSDIGSGWLQVVRLGYNLGAAFEPQAPNATTATITAGNKIQIEGGSAGACNGIISQYKTSNSATAVLYARDEADGTGTNQSDPALGPIRAGPCIRVKRGFQEAMILHFVYGGSLDTVILRLSSLTVSGSTTIWSHPTTFTLTNTGTQSDCTLTLTEVDSSTVRVIASWVSQSISVDQNVTTSALNGTDNIRAGVASFANGALTRQFSSISVQAIQQSTGSVAAAIASTDPNTVGTSQYFVPANYTAVRHVQSTGAVTTLAGASESGSVIPGTFIDTTNDTIEANTTVSANDMHALVPTSNPASRYSVGVKGIATRGDFIDFAYYTRVSDDFKSYVKVIITNLATLDATNMAGLAVSNSCIQVVVVSNSSVILSATNKFTPATDGTVIWRISDALVLTDPGTNGQTTFTLTHGGMTVFTFTLTAGQVGSAAAPGLYDANTQSWRRCGAGAHATNTEIGSIQFIESGLAPDGTSSTNPSYGQATFYLAAFSDNHVDVGDLKALALTAINQGFTTSKGVEAAAQGRKLYCVNGSQSMVVDPINLTVAAWASTLPNTTSLPAGCKLVCNYRGRIVLAHQTGAPSVWYMSRTLDPLDWDFGASPANTSAVAGTNADFGQVGDTITALIPYSDDYLIFGGAHSIWFMEGDPGYGGQVQNLSYETGIIGSRAWTFDEDANLWFIGQSGLYVIKRGTMLPVNVSGNAVIRILDSVNSNTNIVQMAYNANRREIRVFITPNDGTTAGTHLCYSIDDNAWHPDQFPADFGPWSVLNTTGVDDIDRQYIIGGNTGYMYRMDDSVKADDSTAILSYCRFAPVLSSKNASETRLVELQAEGSQSATTNPLNWYLIGAKSATQVKDIAVGDSSNTTGTWFGTTSGFQTPVRVRRRYAAHQLEVRQTSSVDGWDLENVTVFAGAAGRRR